VTAGNPTPAAGLSGIGLAWRDSGQVVLSGPLYRLAADCDAAFTALAGSWRATPEEYPATIELAGLQRTGYLSSFPHLATFPVCLDPDEANLAEFAAGPVLDGGGMLRPTRTAPIREILTPAACYHVYPHHRGEELAAARYLTTRNTCFRREAHYEPLRRQWSFRMREIVCLGSREEVAQFLGRAREVVGALLRELDLPAPWAPATDMFFQPARNPRYLLQRLHPSKHEAVFGGDLAIASVNMHEDHFGTAFDIARGGQPAATGCLAFGIERWLYALTSRHGVDPAGWPDVAGAAERVLAVAPEAGW
jgi:seryl-tRNA synthetase